MTTTQKKEYLNTQFEKIDKVTQKIKLLSDIQDQLYNDLEKEVTLSKEKEDWLWDYVFNDSCELCMPHIEAGLLATIED